MDGVTYICTTSDGVEHKFQTEEDRRRFIEAMRLKFFKEHWFRICLCYLLAVPVLIISDIIMMPIWILVYWVLDVWFVLKNLDDPFGMHRYICNRI